MTKKIQPPFAVISLFLLSLIVITLNNSCTKPGAPAPTPPGPGRTDTVVTPPPVIQDTPSYVKRLEVSYIQSNPPINRRQTDYTFYYDSQKRVAKVGIKNYISVLFDTATTVLLYSGSSLKPNVIIAPNVNRSIPGSIVYDTTWFEYDAFNQIIKDSSNQMVYNSTANIYVRKPIYRYYSYPTITKTFIRWYGFMEASRPGGFIRQDTLDHTNDSLVVKLKSQLYYEQNKLNYASAEGFRYSSLINPLSKLNISGTVFSLIYTPVVNEVLGNSAHKAVNNSNILPYFLDFYSSKVVSTFALGGFTDSDWLIGAQYDAFTFDAIPWSERSTYPSKITVGASTALENKFEYRYFY